jgi:hypothetical protein
VDEKKFGYILRKVKDRSKGVHWTGILKEGEVEEDKEELAKEQSKGTENVERSQTG